MVHNKVYEQTTKLIESNIKIQYKNGANSEDCGKVINEFHHNRLCDLFKDHGGVVAVGNPKAHLDKQLEPTMILNPNLDSPLMKNEIFGPILPIVTYTNIDEAIQFVN